VIYAPFFSLERLSIPANTMPETGIPADRLDRSRRLAGLIRSWCRDEPLTSREEHELAGALLKFILESPVCRRRLRGLSRGMGSDADDEGQFILGLIMARHPRNRLGIMLEDILDADDATVLAESRRRIRSAAINKAFQQLQSVDPNGFKIWGSLWDALRDHPDLFVLLPDGGNPTKVTVVRDGRLRAASAETTADEMIGLLSEVCARHKYMPDRLSALLSIVASDAQWCAVVSISVLFEALRRAAELGILREEGDRLAHADPSPLLRVAIGRAADKARRAFQERLAKSVSDSHFTKDEGRQLAMAIDNLIDECTETGRWPREMKEYLKLQIPGLTDEQYDCRFKARFQYLVGLAESTFYSSLAREYGD
jgi:hypothetical protein